MKATARSQKLIQQEEFREELSGNKEKGLDISLIFSNQYDFHRFLSLCLLQESILSRSDKEKCLILQLAVTV